MIAVDTNLMVYAHRVDSEWHEPAFETLRDLAEGTLPWGIPWPCVHEFFAIVTHPRIYTPPSRPEEAVQQVDAWLDCPTAVTLGEGVNHWARLNELVMAGRVRGPLIHDARIAAICMNHGVSDFLTADRDFSRFPGLKTRNPLVS
jgi:uncharacterized protein